METMNGLFFLLMIGGSALIVAATIYFDSRH